MKSDIVEFVAACHTFQKVKAEHQMSPGLSQSLSVPVQKCDYVNLDYVIGMPRANGYKDAI